MGCSLNLQRQRSCTYPCLDFAGSCSASRRGLSNEYSYDQLDSLINWPESNSIFMSKLRWRALWRKIMREKKKFFKPVHVAYDPFSYAQNFDEGSAWVELENLSRSFSARFAVPSRRPQKVK
ncbi:hypothetical protein IEQ34_004408 [Dendrobium chrysotoxum]|uniref:Uncharacterized protein n=1 Tax=Dendrobium chrysotoxum TaxID=161865 RepID=A0AAV7HG99_DENCH|nr:hypothetical protein IEQ34_004408 [Dendrobium chrysotoxum]